MHTVELRQEPLVPEVVRSLEKVLIINARADRESEGEQAQQTEPSEEESKRGRSYMEEVFFHSEDLHKDGVPRYDYVELPPQNRKMSPDQDIDDWVALAKTIEHYYDRYVGFVIINGTDTIPFCASALSFMLINLGKPIIFTGSLIPADCIFTDLKRNVIIALRVAQAAEVNEVCILFDDKLLRANRTIGASVSHMCPFDSPFLPPLSSSSSGSMQLRRAYLRPYPSGKLSIFPHMYTKILVLQLGPGFQLDLLLKFVRSTEAKSIILHCYGSGNGPTRGDYFKKVMDAANKEDILIVICTQNRYGEVQMAEYEVGREIMALGGVGAAHMTHETVFVKLKFLFGMGYTTSEVRRELLRDLRGELDPKIVG